MKTPNSATVITLNADTDPRGPGAGVDLAPGETLQKVINFDLKEEGNHVLAVTISYYEATDTSGRTRTFRKLYQFICKASLIVRTKVGSLAPRKDGRRRWVMEAQLENCSEEAIHLERVGLELEDGLTYVDCNWDGSRSPRPVLQPGEVEQVSFVVNETARAGDTVAKVENGRLALGVLGISWRNEMGNRGHLTTGKLGTRLSKIP